eukprot:TRINITY_DN1588_c0_g1_i2.p1 TRINITY_DN1588_c0_g1~~TRINITY_DN1588_c0_g1_i2.p1  ORF type:complete len:323 (+),score=51.96 TRINITY_DN1588_c0_g1_i2:658-1626(+)
MLDDILTQIFSKKIAYLLTFVNRHKMAIQLYQQAGRFLKMSGDWELAGLNYMELSEMYLDLDQKQDAASSYVEAGKMYSHLPQLQNYASEAYRNASSIHEERGKIDLAAKLLKKAADWSSMQHNVEQAVQLYDSSAALYAKAKVPIEKTRILVQIAGVRVMDEDYKKAAKRYEEAAKRYLKSPRFYLGAKNLFINSTLCYLADRRMKVAAKAVKRYTSMDKTFKGSKQEMFLTAIIRCVQKDDLKGFDEQSEFMMNLIAMDAQRFKLFQEVRVELEQSAEAARKAKRRTEQEQRQQAIQQEEQAPPPIPGEVHAALEKLEIG